jgi:death on curing protein
LRPSAEDVLFLHEVAVGEFGGSEGVRDVESLKAAVARPWQSTFGVEHFPTPFAKAAALCESIIRRHPFVDGNKRTAVYAGAYLLETFGYTLEVSNEDLEGFAVALAAGEPTAEEIPAWFEKHSRET